MLNQVVLVGRLVQTPEVITTESGKSMTYITVAVPRSFKNAEGEYDVDYVDCVLWQSVAENTAEYCKKGDIIGVKARIQTRMVEEEDGSYKKMEVVAEKITFLPSSKKEKE